MGAFADIVRRSRPTKKEFQLGVEIAHDNRTTLRFFVALTEKERGSEPFFSNARWVFDDGEIVLSTSDDGEGQTRRGSHVNQTSLGVAPSAPGLWSQTRRGSHVNQTSPGHFHIQWNDRELWPSLLFELSYMGGGSTSESRPASGTAARNLQDFIEQKFSKDEGFSGRSRFSYLFGMHPLWIHSIAPVRSKPKRTYDPLKETETPDGSEVPVWLMNLSSSRQEEWEFLRQQLMEFGRASGLFSDIAIRKLGGSRGDPFQLRIKVNGPRANLMDVGYGVSQVLPILVRILTGRRATFLLQQPEVHLHPKGQAELSSLLVDVHRKRGNSFVIETHSDHMIDRVRIEIRRGRIRPEDVSLICLEPVGNHVKSHNIGFDAHANMVGVPQHYRDFFLHEADQLLGLAD